MVVVVSVVVVALLQAAMVTAPTPTSEPKSRRLKKSFAAGRGARLV